MEIIVFYALAFVALAVGTAVIYLALNESVDIKWLYVHYFIRKPLNWSIAITVLTWTAIIFRRQSEFPLWTIAPIVIIGIALIMTYKLHPENAFKAIDFPSFSDAPLNLPLTDEMELAVIEYEGETKCYPLDYVIHHHIVNDHFGTKIVSLTYCALCRSIIPFDVTNMGPLFVASMKNSNMIVADRKTKTFFQQETFKSVIGKLHPSELTMIPFQVLLWSEVKKTIKKPQVIKFNEVDLSDFELPIPGVWKKISKSEFTPGLSKKNHDTSFPVRTRVIGITDKSISDEVFYLKKDVIAKSVVMNEECDFFLVSKGSAVKAFRASVYDQKLDISLENDSQILDKISKSKWNIRGKHISGPLNEDLQIVMISDEYWFGWRKYHPESKRVML